VAAVGSAAVAWDMRESNNTALKIIVLVGIGTFVVLFLISLVMKKTTQPDPMEKVRIVSSESPFDKDRAWRDLEYVVGLGPRPAGSETAETLRKYLREQLNIVGLSVREHRFEVETPLGQKSMVNLIAEVKGGSDSVIMLMNHYDTKYFEGFEFVGANDGGSTTAWMLEMARTLGARRDGCTVWLAWLDGEEAFKKWGPNDGLYGSRALVAHMKETGELARVAGVINVDMIGDRYLCIHRDPDAPDWLLNPVWSAATRFGYSRHFALGTRQVEDDHIPFREAGVPALEIIDFSYGGTLVQHQANWHTGRDTLDKVCSESLKAVGDVIYHALLTIDRQVERQKSAVHHGGFTTGTSPLAR
jgi:Zn-dependent M28 family amino/carboxypeptidase